MLILSIFAAPSAPPRNVTVSTISSTYFILTWSSPPADTWNGDLKEYIVNISEVETGHVYQLYTDNTSIVVSLLHPFYFYECSVTAFTVAAGPYSDYIRTKTLEDGMDN